MNKGLIIIGIVTVIFVLTLIGAIFYLNYGNPIHKFIANRYVPEYLEEQGYSDADIADAHFVQPKHLVNKDYYSGHYTVVFKDEPKMNYYYGVSKKGKEVVQFCERDWSGATYDGPIDYFDKKNTSKHLDEDCVNSLDNRD